MTIFAARLEALLVAAGVVIPLLLAVLLTKLFARAFPCF